MEYECAQNKSILPHIVEPGTNQALAKTRSREVRIRFRAFASAIRLKVDPRHA
jgi:hypothetical protein